MDTSRLIMAIITVLVTLVLFGLAVWGLFTSIWGMAITCGMLSAGFGYFCYNDYLFLSGKKPDNTKTK